MAGAVIQDLDEFLLRSPYATRDPARYKGDFTFGNPHEIPPAGFVEALQRSLTPRHPSWYAYLQSSDEARATVARALREWRGLPFEPSDIHMTAGAFGAIAVALAAIIDPGDEVIYCVPSWFHYSSMTLSQGGVPVTVPMTADFDLDVAAIAAALTPRTRMVIVNTPHNPSGRVFPPATLQRLADLLTATEERTGQTLYLLADEPYSRLVFDGARFYSPSAYYPRTLISYSYGKVLLQPGARLGYLALTPGIADAELLGHAIDTALIIGGWLYPDNIMQYAIADLEPLSIDLDVLQRKRDRLIGALRDIGYAVHEPQGAFYLLPESPMADDVAFTRMLADEEVYVLPGKICSMPGYFRISLTATESAIEASIPVFADAYRRARDAGGHA